MAASVAFGIRSALLNNRREFRQKRRASLSPTLPVTTVQETGEPPHVCSSFRRIPSHARAVFCSNVASEQTPLHVP
eukprot:NODE_18223_length_904_cov_2.214929.p7 GENE.NODE_18223_length_904_cov_2.214929~~NODE_18223_length_904_cov_2.214929.p7  ORF type:complete len:76 (-),score=7.36 NODE_18223_length_904_cov_2.214929:494-721(-)